MIAFALSVRVLRDRLVALFWMNESDHSADARDLARVHLMKL